MIYFYCTDVNGKTMPKENQHKNTTNRDSQSTLQQSTSFRERVSERSTTKNTENQGEKKANCVKSNTAF